MTTKVRKTLQEMLIDRNYHCCALNPNETEYVISYSEQSKTHYVAIFIIDEPKIGIKHIKEMMEKVYSRMETISHIILVYANEITTFARQNLDQLKDIRIELFSFHELSFNVSKHELVPKHVIDTQNLNYVLQTFMVKKHNLPKILYNDPMVKYIGARKGDLIKIYRTPTIYYRVVV